MNAQATMPLENFIQAVQSQLDKAQSAMAVKARNLNLPMTFAIKDINLDLRAHVEFAAGEIRIRPSGADEKDASVFHIVFTAITRPMIEENAAALATDPEDQGLDALEDEFTEEERRKLEWVGVRTVGKLREVERSGAGGEIGRVTNLPVERLKKALRRAAAPMVEDITPITPSDDPAAKLRRILKVRGRNLNEEGQTPVVTIAGRPASIVKATSRELLVEPDADQWAGQMQIEAAPDLVTSFAFDLSAHAQVPPAAVARNGALPEVPEDAS